MALSLSSLCIWFIQAIYWADSKDIKIQTMFNRSYYYKQNRLQASHTHTPYCVFFFFSFHFLATLIDSMCVRIVSALSACQMLWEKKKNIRFLFALVDGMRQKRRREIRAEVLARVFVFFFLLSLRFFFLWFSFDFYFPSYVHSLNRCSHWYDRIFSVWSVCTHRVYVKVQSNYYYILYTFISQCCLQSLTFTLLIMWPV